MKTILTRIGENSKYIFNGDYEQCDNREIKKGKEINGLKYVMEIYKDMPEIGIVTFENGDIIRNPIISKLLDRFDAQQAVPRKTPNKNKPENSLDNINSDTYIMTGPDMVYKPRTPDLWTGGYVVINDC